MIIGTPVIDSITSSNPVFYAEGGISIPQGDTTQVAINFYSEFSGVYEVDLTVYSSDPSPHAKSIEVCKAFIPCTFV